MKTLLLILLAVLPPAVRAQELAPQSASAEEAAAVANKLMTSLFFRGEVADKILDSGEAGRLVNLEGVETNAEARGLLINWIRRNPEKAAQLYLNLKGAGGKVHTAIETREMTWEFNPAFLEAIKALNAAAGSSSVSREAMEIAARRLYGGSREEADSPVLKDGGGKAGGKGLTRDDFADYRLNKGALDAELTRAAAWMDAARPEAVRLNIGDSYGAALSIYQEFLVAASGLKGRAAMTAQESARLETLRSALRAALGALALRARIAELAAAEAALASARGEPGASALLAVLGKLRGELEELAALAESGQAGAKEVAGLVNLAEGKFAGLYLAYSAYDGLLSLKRRSAPGAFSCLYDYAAYRYLAAFYPASPYPKARAELAAAAGALDGALAKAGAGDLQGALAAADPARLEAAAAQLRSSSSFYRAAQFFGWGLLFRPVELKALPGKTRPAFRPAFTIAEIVRGR
ncbi:MAG: hypothetical protein PHV33_07255 [Elusimicrobiales bacterium]|nr:hypothetical protein [Elusimicrobiales bacterium]